jgi:hypothetical protein
MIANQMFHCPHCGAPGQVNYGQAEYSCMCRMGHFQQPPAGNPSESVPQGGPSMSDRDGSSERPFDIADDADFRALKAGDHVWSDNTLYVVRRIYQHEGNDRVELEWAQPLVIRYVPQGGASPQGGKGRISATGDAPRRGLDNG